MTVIRLLAANVVLLVAWVGVLLLLGSRLGPLELGLLVLGVVTSSVLVSRRILGRDGNDPRLVTVSLPPSVPEES
ncbi:hypothetical protein CLV56_4121 [Mumia flava]|uniref:Uncharacterized protein n=1 Tax=Mumia flava TaxID=1348852 RepID=A0A2M9AQA3_9ACTN|nr:hypothetical protein [Mumia flava]PJJ47862.1 hypothetical protein CLV56_4121 [Mumia flava]